MTGTVRRRGSRWQAQVSWSDGGRRRYAAATAGSEDDAWRLVATMAEHRGLTVQPPRPRGVLLARPGEQRPFDLQPLVEVAGGSMSALARAGGLHRRQLYRWQAAGLSVDQADEVATRLGLHPAEVWPTWWDAAA